jgi:CRP-like cAMP-binding protein
LNEEWSAVIIARNCISHSRSEEIGSMFSEALEESEFLSRIPVPLRAKLAALSTRREFAAKAVLFQEHQPHEFLYLIEAGHVRLEMSVPVRGRVTLLTAGPGDVLAWSPLLGSGAMTATATAMEPVTVWAIHGSQLRALCEQDHELGFHVMRQFATALSHRLIATRIQLLDLFAGPSDATGSGNSSQPSGEARASVKAATAAETQG